MLNLAYTHPEGTEVIDNASEDRFSAQRYCQIVQAIFKAWYLCNNHTLF